MNCKSVNHLLSKALKPPFAKVFYGLNFKIAYYQNELLKTKFLVPRSSILKYSLSSLNIFENKVVNNGKTKLMVYIHYWLLFKNDNFEYKTTSERLSLNFFLLFHNFLSHRFLSYYIISNSYVQRNITSVIYIAFRILWAVSLWNILHNVGNMYS